MKEMKVKIKPSGDVSFYDFQGAVGEECVDMTKALEGMLGKVKERKFTDEYYKKGPKEYNYNTSGGNA